MCMYYIHCTMFKLGYTYLSSQTSFLHGKHSDCVLVCVTLMWSSLLGLFTLTTSQFLLRHYLVFLLLQIFIA